MGNSKFKADYCKWANKQGYYLNERKAEEILALSQTGYEVMQCLIQHKPEEDAVFAFIQKKRSEGKCGK